MDSFIDITLNQITRQSTDVQRELLRRLTAIVGETSDTDLIVKTPGIVGGSARIAGTRLAVWGLINWLKVGWSEEELLKNYPTISREALAAAREYYREHRDEIDREIAENEAA